MTYKQIKRETLSEKIIEELKEMIINKELRPGDCLPSERELAQLFGVSRQPIREALRAMSALGLAEIRNGEGTFLCQDLKVVSDDIKFKFLLKKHTAANITEARNAIEIETARLAALRANAEDKAEIKAALDSFTKLIDQRHRCDEKYWKTDLQFHIAIAKASHNPVLLNMLQQMRNHIVDLNQTFIINSDEYYIHAKEEHVALYDAIMTGDPDIAVAIMRDNVNGLMPYVQKKEI